MNANATQLDAGADPRGATKFLYASGAKPLSGYTIKRGVGRGGFGEVYYAVSDAGKEVALKLIRRNLDVELRGVGHCLNLKHPNLLSIFDVKRDDEDNSWIVMEFVAGESLDAAIERNPQGMLPREVLRWMNGVAAGVSYLHEHGIVHRDLKPGNIFSDQGVIKLGDYGLSKFISCSRRSGQTESIGTVHYMAPEVARGRYGKEIDIYALGIILYEMLTGRVPFDGESVGEVLMKHLTADPDLTAISEPYRTVVARALAKDPDVRFATVGELIAALPTADGSAPANGYPAAMASPPFGGRAPSAPRAQPTPTPGPQPSTGPSTVDEPILRALSDAWRQLRSGWRNVSPGMRLVILLGGVWFMMKTGPEFERPLVLLLIVYLVYLLIRTVVVNSKQPQRTAPLMAQPAPVVAPVRAAQRHDNAWMERKRWRESSSEAAETKSTRERFVELLGSMLFSSVVTATLSLAMVLAVMREASPRPEQFAWLAITSTLGAWAILIPSKIWENRKADPALRRFVMLVIGLALGAAAYGVQSGLLVQLPFDHHFRDSKFSPEYFYAPDGAPLMYAFLAYFGALFLALRWWRAADPRRTSRLSLFATAMAALAGLLINLIFQFPQPWGIMAAATISIAVQLASPWARKKYLALRNRFQVSTAHPSRTR